MDHDNDQANDEFMQRLIAAAPSLSKEQIENIRRRIRDAPDGESGRRLGVAPPGDKGSRSR
jgi:hypothetical protein